MQIKKTNAENKYMYNKILIVKHIENEGAGTLETFFKGRGFVPVILELAKGESFPENIKEYKAVVIMGGPMNVYEEDKYYFLKEENIFIKEILREKIPFLGICFGAQLLAKALGAKIKKAPVKEIGWYEISLTKEGKEDPFFKSIVNIKSHLLLDTTMTPAMIMTVPITFRSVTGSLKRKMEKKKIRA